PNDGSRLLPSDSIRRVSPESGADGDPQILVEAGRCRPEVGVAAQDGEAVTRWGDRKLQIGGVDIAPGPAVIRRQCVLRGTTRITGCQRGIRDEIQGEPRRRIRPTDRTRARIDGRMVRVVVWLPLQLYVVGHARGDRDHGFYQGRI